MKRPQDISRFIFAIFFLLGGIANTVLVLTRPGLYRDFADLAFLTLYRQVWLGFIFPNIQPMVALVAVLEWAFAVLLLWRGMAVRLGAIVGAGFMVFLIPFWWSGGSLANLVFALILFWLAFSKYPFTVPELLRRGEGISNDQDH